jgi:hypothetical protein
MPVGRARSRSTRTRRRPWRRSSVLANASWLSKHHWKWILFGAFSLLLVDNSTSALPARRNSQLGSALAAESGNGSWLTRCMPPRDLIRKVSRCLSVIEARATHLSVAQAKTIATSRKHAGELERRILAAKGSTHRRLPWKRVELIRAEPRRVIFSRLFDAQAGQFERLDQPPSSDLLVGLVIMAPSMQSLAS